MLFVDFATSADWLRTAGSTSLNLPHSSDVNRGDEIQTACLDMHQNLNYCCNSTYDAWCDCGVLFYIDFFCPPQLDTARPHSRSKCDLGWNRLAPALGLNQSASGTNVDRQP